jgi:chromosome transmission fidelity protein 8
MLIPIRSEGDGPPAWAMIELQGEIERIIEAIPGEPFDVGTLTATDDTSVQLVIGYHRLEGTKMALKKPVAILEKIESNDDDDNDDNEVRYKVIGVVREKLIFKQRPRAIITNPTDTATTTK